MEGFLFPILIAAAVTLLAWWAFAFISSVADRDGRRLQQRLSTSTPGKAAIAALSITLPEDGRMPDFLARKPFFQTVARKLLQVAPDTTLQRFLIIVGACGVAVGALTGLISGNPLATLVATGVAAYIPIFLLNARHAKRQRLIMEQLPEALDFLSRVMRAGHSLSTGFQMMSEELPVPLSTEFRKCYDQHSLGQALEDGLREMSLRIDATDFHFFVTAVLIQRQTGGDLSEVLNNISGMIRERTRLQRHVKAKTAEGRFTGYIMVAFPAVMFCICYTLNAELYGKFFTTSLGRFLLMAAVGLQLMGLFMIKKITTVKV